MGQMTNILVKDDANPAVEQTLVPITDTPNPLWRANASGVPIEGQIRCTFSEELMKNGSYRIQIKTEVPVMETLGASGSSSGYVAPQKVAYVNTAFMTMFANKRSTTADRANLLKLHLGICQGASGTTATGVLNNASAADAFKTSVLPGPQLFTAVILPS